MSYGLIKVVKDYGPKYKDMTIHAHNVRDFADGMWLASLDLMDRFLHGWRPSILLFLTEDEMHNVEFYAEKPRAKPVQDVTLFPDWSAWSVYSYDFLRLSTLKWEIDAVMTSATYHHRIDIKNHDLFAWDRWLMMHKTNYAHEWKLT